MKIEKISQPPQKGDNDKEEIKNRESLIAEQKTKKQAVILLIILVIAWILMAVIILTVPALTDIIKFFSIVVAIFFVDTIKKLL
mgnify:CR=1 FL=1